MIGLAIASLVVFALYLWGVSRTSWPRLRTACFASGLLFALVIAIPAEDSLTRHMVEHGVVVAAAAPLLVLGRPVTLALRSLPRASARDIAALMGSRPVGFLTRPPVALLVFGAVQAAFHLTPLFRASLADGPLHESEHALLLGSSILLWTVALAVEPVRHRWPPLARAFLLLAAMPFADAGAVRLMMDGDGAAGTAMAVSMAPVGLAAVLIAWRGLADEEARERRREDRAQGDLARA